MRKAVWTRSASLGQSPIGESSPVTSCIRANACITPLNKAVQLSLSSSGVYVHALFKNLPNCGVGLGNSRSRLDGQRGQHCD